MTHQPRQSFEANRCPVFVQARIGLSDSAIGSGLTDFIDSGLTRAARKREYGEMFVSVTRLRVRSWRYLLPFIVHSIRASRQARRADGNLATDLLRDAKFTFWTRSVWRDEAAMRAFMMTGAHSRAMPKLLEWCDEASVVNWEQPGSDLPDWSEAHRWMASEGRRSKVYHPSAAQTAFEIPPPKC